MRSVPQSFLTRLLISATDRDGGKAAFIDNGRMRRSSDGELAASGMNILTSPLLDQILHAAPLAFQINAMSFLPNEIWLAIIPYCDFSDTWLNLRPVNSQLKSCTEQYCFEKQAHKLILALSFIVPSYDVRRRETTKAIFEPIIKPGSSLNLSHSTGTRIHFGLVCHGDPALSFVVTKWQSIREASAHSLLPGAIDDRLRWTVSMSSERSPGAEMRLPLARIEGLHDDVTVNVGEVSCDWQMLLTGYLKKLRDLT